MMLYTNPRFTLHYFVSVLKCNCSHTCNTVAASRQCQFCGYAAEPPLLTSTFDDQIVVEGDAVSISCAASGSPDPTFVFRKVSICVCLLASFLVLYLQIY